MSSRDFPAPADEYSAGEVLQRMRQGLLSNLAHDLRSPLVAIRGYTKMVRSAVADALDEAQRGHIEMVLENVDRVVALSGRVARLAEYGVWRVERCDLARMIDGAAGPVREAAELRSIRIVREASTSEARTLGDASRLERAVEVLLHVAVASASEGAEITVGLTVDPEVEEIVMHLASSGFVFDEEVRGSLFERTHVQLPEPKQRRPLALWEADDIVRLHGGRLDYTEIEDGRCAFILRLPTFEGLTIGEGRAGR